MLGLPPSSTRPSFKSSLCAIVCRVSLCASLIRLFDLQISGVPSQVIGYWYVEINRTWAYVDYIRSTMNRAKQSKAAELRCMAEMNLKTLVTKIFSCSELPMALSDGTAAFFLTPCFLLCIWRWIFPKSLKLVQSITRNEFKYFCHRSWKSVARNSNGYRSWLKYCNLSVSYEARLLCSENLTRKHSVAILLWVWRFFGFPHFFPQVNEG